jgi:hypothetical protein
MFSKLGKIGLAFVVAAVGTVAVSGDVSAANLNTHGTAFQQSDRPPGYDTTIGYSSLGVFTLVQQSVEVVGPVIRSPTDSSTQGFYIDGTNAAGATTSFVLFAYDYQGNLQSSVSFDATAPNEANASYDLYETLSPIDAYSYVSLVAGLPANNRGTLLGVTAL